MAPDRMRISGTGMVLLGLWTGCSSAPREEFATGASNGGATDSRGDDGQAPSDPADDDLEGDSSSTGEGSTGSGDAKFDVAGQADGGDVVPCRTADDFEFSNIWIANSNEGTVSKLDTVTGEELARYATGEGPTNPSRTSVNLHGDVAVVNRGSEVGGVAVDGGIIKIAARLEECIDADADGQIRSSTGPDDVLPWGSDECVVWSQPLPASDADPEANQGPRPVAWEPGIEADGCTISDNPRVWVGYFDAEQDEGVFLRLDGATGNTLDEVRVSGFTSDSYGPYGGAVDREGNFWVVGHGSSGPLVMIDAVTLDATFRANPGLDYRFYGLAMDSEGQPWITGSGGVYRYDPVAQDWNHLGFVEGSTRGLAVDRSGRAWIAGNGPCRLIEVDVVTETITNESIPLPGCQLPVGVSIDVEGFVWVVDQWAQAAFKVDPDTHAVVTSPASLYSPYTYSDMTGAGLNLVANPPAG